ncbi:unnamed protein product [Mycena citricolor]|uniref:Beta-glucuronidase C-terminal domain-containing protein n=1 Tax=Mycena citricolor TaxID=2018698 RepID=A0AAD2H2V5_9AGAR|nr:unnamed protein product [Mycena citricolor]
MNAGRMQRTALLSARVTVYSQRPWQGTKIGTANVVAYTGAAAYDKATLVPPPVPSPPIPTQFVQPLNVQPPQGASIRQSGSFYGFSIEFSVIDQIYRPSGIEFVRARAWPSPASLTTTLHRSSFIQVPFLNLMSHIQTHGGSVRVRIGGNTQDTAAMVPALPSGRMLMKDKHSNSSTPPLLYTPEVIYLLANISSLVNVGWYLGIPLNDTQHPQLEIAEVAERILGDRLLGLQVGNEPDLYPAHNRRSPTYGPVDYVRDFGLIDAALRADPGVPHVNKKLVGPSISGTWRLEDVFNASFLTDYAPSLAALSVESYPDNNCAKVLKTGGPVVDPQTVFSNYLNHTSSQEIMRKYLNSTLLAQSLDLPFHMLETNTASCGGFPGVSDSFGSALWALDYGLQMAHSNFSGALLHLGGLSDSYNVSAGRTLEEPDLNVVFHSHSHVRHGLPNSQTISLLICSAPPTNQSTFRGWTVGPVYYSALVAAEVFGKSNQSQIIDLQMNNENIFTPGYAIYENGTLARVALFNFITDPSGASDYSVALQAVTLPKEVKVKYLLAPSVSTKENITWAGQTFGANLASDGRLSGQLSVARVPCDANTSSCTVHVPAPGFALVSFLNPATNETPTPTPGAWPTTAHTKATNTLTVDPSVLATSNGHRDDDAKLGSTSPERIVPGPRGGRPAKNVRSGALEGRSMKLWVVCACVFLAWSMYAVT